MTVKFLRIGIIISVCMLFLNIILIGYLPNNVANQIAIGTGQLTSYTSKYVFMLSLPIGGVLISLYLYFRREFRTWYYLNVYILLVFCDVAIIVTNLIYK